MRFCRPVVFRGRGGAVARGREITPSAETNLAPPHPRTPVPSNTTPAPPNNPLAPPKLRDRWPFLNEPDCPVELQALITRRITAYHQYSKLYPKLRGCESVEELSTVCGQLLDAYLDNQAIFREMEHYQKHRKVLGRHPFFRHYQQLAHLRSRTTKQLFEEKQRTLDNIWRVKSELRKGDKPHLDGKRRQRLQEYTLKLQEINNLLGEG